MVVSDPQVLALQALLRDLEDALVNLVSDPKQRSPSEIMYGFVEELESRRLPFHVQDWQVGVDSGLHPECAMTLIGHGGTLIVWKPGSLEIRQNLVRDFIPRERNRFREDPFPLFIEPSQVRAPAFVSQVSSTPKMPSTNPCGEIALPFYPGEGVKWPLPVQASQVKKPPAERVDDWDDWIVPPGARHG